MSRRGRFDLRQHSTQFNPDEDDSYGLRGRLDALLSESDESPYEMQNVYGAPYRGRYMFK